MKVGTGALRQNRMTQLFFYADLKTSHGILANEWDRHIFLSSLEKARALLRTQIYGFCVLDDRLRLLAGGKDVKVRTVRRMLSAALERFEREAELIGEWDSIPHDTSLRVKVIRIEEETDAVLALRYIHLTPSSEGYIISAADWWWSSYNTYRGFYQWPLVDTTPVMRFLSGRDENAAHTLTEFHRRGESLCNPVPECIRKGEYEPLILSGERILFPQGDYG